MDDQPQSAPPLTIYDVARHAGVSIASVSRVLNDRDNPRPETRARVLLAVAELGFVPDGAARALSSRLKEVVGVVIRRHTPAENFEEELESLIFYDVVNRGVELAAQRRGYDLLMSSVDVDDHGAGPGKRISSIAGKSDGLILHDRVLTPNAIARLAEQVPIVTLAGVATKTTINVRSDNSGGMRALVRHLAADHGYRTLAYLAGHADSPDNVVRARTFAAAAAKAGAEVVTGPAWQGDYSAAGGMRAVRAVLAAGAPLPRAIACANDQAALGVLNALAQAGLDVPGDVAVVGFDDIPLARHVRPQLTTVRQPIQELGLTAFDLLYALINGEETRGRTVVLPTRLMIRGSCGCPRTDPGTSPDLTPRRMT